MIKYSLKCDQDHSFESWFQSGDAFDALRKAGHVSCVICGSTKVEKSLMAPRVRPARKAVKAVAVPEKQEGQAGQQPLTRHESEEAIAKLRKEVEENSDYVGDNFATEARKMHQGDAPERSIYGRAGLKEAKALIDEGVPVLPLPFAPKDSMN